MGTFHSIKPLLLISDGYAVYRKMGRLCIQTQKREHCFPLSSVSVLMLAGRGSVSTEALQMLSKAGVGLCLLSGNFRIKAVLTSEERLGSIVERRLKHYELWKKNRLRIASRILHLKIEQIEAQFSLDLSHIKQMVEGAVRVEELMGYEGLASRYMFEIVSKRLRIFRERKYRPATDPVNALLSLSYSIAYEKARGLLLSMSLDPYLSFLHSANGRHASLASDLIEPARPIITRFVLELFESGVLRASDFTRQDESHRLKVDKFHVFFEKYSEIANDVLDLIWKNLLNIMEEVNEAGGV